ncbi:hypothetical protein Sps_04834 [Shewanella psychrophila]|uniref:Uncharacterized protein n=1 Tax=Shewanella psychrophila TaxID=225848 RepID=A0A1S6HWG6_9GAMM|nr:hypothetical protein [Shewanella psychrophila]AQS39916.1 hypothetical protein Sps_04834 [Shewanella psychrophila]
MNIITDSIWYCSHPEKLSFLEKNKNIYKLIFNRSDSGKVNLCINIDLQKKDESKNIPLAKFLIDNGSIKDDAHYYVDHSNGKQYSVFYKGGVIYPFSDRVCGEDLVNRLKKYYSLDDTKIISLEQGLLKITRNKEVMVKASVVIMTVLGMFILSSAASATFFFYK